MSDQMINVLDIIVDLTAFNIDRYHACELTMCWSVLCCNQPHTPPVLYH